MTNSAVCPVCGNPQAQGLLDDACTTRLEHDLGDVAAIVGELETTVSKQARIGTGGKSGLARERMPLNVGAMQVADDLQNTLTTWARDASGEHWMTLLAYYDPISGVTVAAARILLSHVDAIRKHPAVEELVDEITEAIRRARQIVDRPADRQYLGTCLAEFEGVTCTEEIWARPGAAEVTCKVCGVTHEVGERRAWLLRQAKDLLCSVKEASQYIGEVGHIRVTEASIRGYVHRGRLAYRPGGTMIRLGDLLTVVMDDGERRTA